jgi:nucleoside-diphosphate-sugar epimerase
MDSAGKIVLVTGINGYIASHIGLQLLKKGYTVRGTSRLASVQHHLLSDAFKGYESQYEHVVVSNITGKGAFDEVVKGVFAIIHTASPLHFNGTTVDEYFGPAVGGVESILESTTPDIAGPQLEAFVFTSSIAAATDGWQNSPTHAYSEDDWNETGESMARGKFSAQVAYGASKALAETALWDWADNNEHEFSVSAVLPGVVMGPPIAFPPNPALLNATLEPIWQIYSGKAKTMPPPIGYAPFIDVRDVAAMHVWCLEHPNESADQRYFMTNGIAPPQAVADLLRKKYPERGIVVGAPGEGYDEKDYWYPTDSPSFVATKAYEALEVERFTGFEKMIDDTIEAFEKEWPGQAKN